MHNMAMHVVAVQPPNPFVGNLIQVLDEEVKLWPCSRK